MQKILRNGSVLTYSPLNPPCIAQVQRRLISRNTAIHRGLRQGVTATYKDHRDRPWEKRSKSRVDDPLYQREQDDRGKARLFGKDEQDSPLGFNNPETTPRPSAGRNKGAERKLPSPARSRSYDEPVSIPYTTAASEFLYGYNPVCAALKAQRRKLYKIYLHPRVASRDGDVEAASIRRLAEKANVQIIDVNDSWLKVMDKMSDDRPHNGCVLEVSPLPQLPVLALGAVQTGETGEEHFNLKLDNQSNEELAINGGIPWLSFKSDRWRSPFVLLIDDVLNPGNLGAIIRSAYFLGVDAIAISTRTCAPLNSEAVKASAGAIEAIPIFAIHNVASFLENSVANGYWRIYCATTPDPKRPAFSSEKGSLVFTTKTDWRETTQSQNNKRFGPTFSSPLGVGHPVMLAIGGEQKGLDWKITRKAFAFVQIVPGISQLDVGVDSLNVSAASAILCAEFMRSKPAGLGISTRGRQTLEADRLGRPGPVYGRER